MAMDSVAPTNSRPAEPVRPQAPVPILAYHQTARPPRRGVPCRTFTLSPGAFRAQLQGLKLMGYRGLSMRDLEPYLSGERSGKVVGITLDDGYLNNFEHALPILREFGFTATSFMVSGHFGGSNLWDQRVGVPAAALMDVAHLKTWVAAGMEVGSHTRNHVNLHETDPATAREEIAASKRDLESALGCEVRHFCYPYGLYRAEHAQMVREAGYLTGSTSDSTRVQPGTDPMLLPRISIFAETTVPLLMAQVATGFEEWRYARAAQRAGAAPASAAAPSPAPKVEEDALMS
jgi:peptidoglycan/xylan/chitin deacetylase (PgdA/CDA1 family)